MSRPTEPSEYGGVSGLIAPYPHNIEDSAYEQASLAIRTDPADVTSSPESQLALEQKEWQRRG